MDMMQRLTEKIDRYAVEPWGTTEDIHNNLWQEVGDLLNFKENRRENMLRDWKYKSEFETAMQRHENGMQIFRLLTWEHSFVLTLLYAYYH